MAADHLEHPAPKRGSAGTANAKLEQLRQLLREGKSDPLRAVQNMERADRILNEMTEEEGWPYNSRAGAYQILRVPNVTALDPGAINTETQMKWPSAGTVLAVYGTPVAPTIAFDTAQASLSVRVTYRGGDKNLIINGEGADFAIFRALFTDASPWFPLSITVTGEDTTWQIAFQNEQAAGGAILTPALYFAFVPWPDPKGSQGKW